jgi:hypothetical protein
VNPRLVNDTTTPSSADPERAGVLIGGLQRRVAARGRQAERLAETSLAL